MWYGVGNDSITNNFLLQFAWPLRSYPELKIPKHHPRRRNPRPAHLPQAR